jgi:hypothetical protein
MGDTMMFWSGIVAGAALTIVVAIAVTVWKG